MGKRGQVEKSIVCGAFRSFVFHCPTSFTYVHISKTNYGVHGGMYVGMCVQSMCGQDCKPGFRG